MDIRNYSTLQETNTVLFLLTNVLKMKAYDVNLFSMIYYRGAISSQVLLRIKYTASLALNHVQLFSNEKTAN
jgi:hypothetical protein